MPVHMMHREINHSSDDNKTYINQKKLKFPLQAESLIDSIGDQSGYYLCCGYEAKHVKKVIVIIISVPFMLVIG